MELKQITANKAYQADRITRLGFTKSAWVWEGYWPAAYMRPL